MHKLAMVTSSVRNEHGPAHWAVELSRDLAAVFTLHTADEPEVLSRGSFAGAVVADAPSIISPPVDPSRTNAAGGYGILMQWELAKSGRLGLFLLTSLPLRHQGGKWFLE